MTDTMTKNFYLYEYKERIWLVNPKTKEWVITYYSKTKYVFWCYDFFKTIFMCLSMDMKQRQPIKNWVQYRMKLEVGDNVEPDKFPYDYDWSSDFNIDEVIIHGVYLSSL